MILLFQDVLGGFMPHDGIITDDSGQLRAVPVVQGLAHAALRGFNQLDGQEAVACGGGRHELTWGGGGRGRGRGRVEGTIVHLLPGQYVDTIQRALQQRGKPTKRDAAQFDFVAETHLTLNKTEYAARHRLVKQGKIALLLKSAFRGMIAHNSADGVVTMSIDYYVVYMPSVVWVWRSSYHQVVKSNKV